MFEILLMTRSAESDSNIFCHNHWLPTSIYSLMPQKPIAPLTSVFSLGMKRCRVNFDCTEPCWCLKLDCYHGIRYKHSETYLPRTVFDEQFNSKTFLCHILYLTDVRNVTVLWGRRIIIKLSPKIFNKQFTVLKHIQQHTSNKSPT